MLSKVLLVNDVVNGGLTMVEAVKSAIERLEVEVGVAENVENLLGLSGNLVADDEKRECKREVESFTLFGKREPW